MQQFHNNLNTSFEFLREATVRRLDFFLKKVATEPFEWPALKIEPDDAPLNHFLLRYKPGIEEYTILLLSLLPHVQPFLLDNLMQQFLPNGGDFAEIGGVKGTNYRGTLPTGETALFILAGDDLARRMQIMQLFSTEHFFSTENILYLEPVKEGEPRMSGKIILQPEYVDLLTTGKISKPAFGPDFPAKAVNTKMDWEDLVLNAKTAQSIKDISTWLAHNAVFMNEWGMHKKVKPGFRALFHGPPGTGKTLTASLLGKTIPNGCLQNRPVANCVQVHWRNGKKPGKDF